MKEAAEMAGLNLRGLISETTATVLAYLHDEKPCSQNILVYDLGGTSFEAALVKMQANENGRLPVIEAARNDSYLGGRNWDDRLYEFVLEACCDETGLNRDEIDAETGASIRIKTEFCKKNPCAMERNKIRILMGADSYVVSVPIERQNFERLTSDLVDWIMEIVEDTLQCAGNMDVDMVLLAGGASNMPMIRNALEARILGKVRYCDPECSVALGAALYGQGLASHSGPKKASLYAPEQIAEMIIYMIEHSHDDIAKELIGEVDWKAMTPKQLYDFFCIIRYSGRN